MGGKNKQRTKGNLRPSNSGRAAELLAKEQGTVPGFIGFGTSQSDLGYVPAIQGAEEIDSLVDSDFRMVLRKLSKKDVTTKLKAMQEFGTMCTERETEIVKGVLPYWPRIFCKISLDHDRRVREATQQAFEKLILKVKKHLAPYLKSVMGYWLMAQCDTYTPAACAAKDAFEAAFPPSKQPEAIAFCKDEITIVLQDHLLKETPDTLSDPQTVPEEEREAKFYRVVTCSLLALKKLLCLLPDNELDSLEEKFKSLLSQNKFWKYGKHNVPQIRSAYFELVSALCQRIPHLMKDEASKVSPSVLLSIDDSDPVVCPALWEAVLYTLTTVEDCWLHVNAKKSVFPKLSTVVRDGGRGLATVIYPYLLPFISKLPQSITDPKLDFFKNFLTSLVAGLATERIRTSFSECSAVVSAFFECLRFIMQQNLGEEEIEQMLINDQLIPFIDTVLKDPGLQHGQLFNHLAETLSSWEAKADIEKDDKMVQNLENVLFNFWEKLSEICVEKINEPEADVKSVLGVSNLLEVLQKPKSSLKSNKKKNGKVRFADQTSEGNKEIEKYVSSEGENSEASELPTESESFLTNNSSDIMSPLRKKPLEDLVCKLAEMSINYVNEQKSEQHLRFLSTLLDSFSSSQVFKMLLGDEKESIVKGKPLEITKLAQKNPAVQFLYHKLIGWLNEDQRKDAGFLVDILYSALCCCESDVERKDVLDDLTKEDLEWNSLHQVIQKACSSSDKHALVTSWLKGNILGEKLVALADGLCNKKLEPTLSSDSHFSEEWTLLSLVLSQHVKNDYLIGEVYVGRIIDKLHETLYKTKTLSEAENSDSSVSFICDVAYNYFSSAKGCLLMPSSEDLLLTLFQLCAQSKEKTHLPDFLICKLKNTWLSGVNLLVHQTGSTHKQSTFLHSSALWLKTQAQSSSLDNTSLQVLLSAVDDLLNTLLESEGTYLLGVYIGSVMPNNSEWEEMRQSLPIQWLYRPLLEGRLSLNYECFKTDFKEQDTKTLPSHLCTSALLSKMIFVALKKKIVLENNVLEKIIAELLYSLQWCEELDNPPIFVTGFCKMLQKMDITFDNFRVLGNIAGLLQLLFNRSRENGTLWSLIIAKLILSRSISSDEVKPHYKRKESFFPLTEGNLHTIQSLCPFLSKEEKKEFSAQCIPALLGWTKEDLCSTDGGFGHLAIFNSCLQTRSIDDGELLHGILKIIISWKKEHEDIFLFSCNLSEASPEVLGVNIEIIRFLSLFLKYCSSPLAQSEWDFIMCSMLAWLETTNENQALCSVPLIQLFACVSCDLACDLSAFFDSTTLDTIGNLPVNLISEWKEFFSQGIHSLLLPLLVTATGEDKDLSETSFKNAMLKPMCETLTYISKDQLLSQKLPVKLVAGQKTNLPEHLQTLLNTLAPLLLFRARPVQIAVYHMLFKLMPELPQYDQDNLKSYGDEEEEPALSPPAVLMSLLSTQEDLLENVLGCVPVGQIVTIKPLSEDFCYVLGYLLTWKLILTFFKAASSQLRALYSMYLRKTKSLNKLLYHLFRLMPENPTYGEAAIEVSNKDPKTFFTEELQLSIRETTTLPYHIPHLACSVYHMTLKDLPAMVRLWWNSSEKRVFNIVDRFTSKYVSNVLSFQEISSVQTSTQLFNGMTVKARATTREVMATYTIEDIVIELIIQLPSNYPLGSITVESGKRVGVAVQQWRNWMLQLSTYLTHQNGSIMEGLALWKNNVDKRFEGVEDCMICFSVIHGFNYSLPKKACRTCKKKFHSACLYKWFTSSNKSTCPLCRETFF
ncbi:listerin E3 ubiquitin protein ligase 1 [Ictidomys tridecemlineatus]|uniref:E3 ubiquitin-protein ligase listerin n=2 Tax=Ictidomys tridecemlineatus TaxID=43179 RepID=I3MS74_ICTTR|nr:E3 ubiquitin-protein ligase listerin isoform X1 [Ictidomys tridecemlineatus]KAG3283791.1 listerin E3 ubiquitin protein ligase 1 [Ictidomys tridecemlineatus]